MNPVKKPKKIEGEAVRIAEPDSSTEPCEVLISKLPKGKCKLKCVVKPVKPNNQCEGDTSSSEPTSDTAESSDMEETDWPSLTLNISDAYRELSDPEGQDYEENEDLNERMSQKAVSEQPQDLTSRREPEEFLQEDVIVISDTENP